MKHPAAFLCVVVMLAGCQTEEAALLQPVEITEDSAGFYCQMALLEHVGPKGQIHLDGMPAPLFFSQVKDTVAYLHMPEQSHAVRATYVQDMSDASWEMPGPWIRAEEAIYVIGSDALGGMDAPEFVPFSNHAAAEAFAREHGGVAREFAMITEQDVLTVPSGSTDAPVMDHHDMAGRLSALSQTKGN